MNFFITYKENALFKKNFLISIIIKLNKINSIIKNYIHNKLKYLFYIITIK